MTQDRLDIFEKVLLLYGEYVLLNLYSSAKVMERYEDCAIMRDLMKRHNIDELFYYSLLDCCCFHCPCLLIVSIIGFFLYCKDNNYQRVIQTFALLFLQQTSLNQRFNF